MTEILVKEGIMKTEGFKWLYTFILLLVTVAWSVFTVLFVRASAADPSAASLFEASGTTLLLGALITWNALIVQYWFRKKTPE